MPPSALDMLSKLYRTLVRHKVLMPHNYIGFAARQNIQYPMLFKLTNSKKNRETHCGVLEFVADEGKIFIPYWVATRLRNWFQNFLCNMSLCSVFTKQQMMRNLLLEENDIVKLENVSLPVATYTKFQPQSTDFLDITNPKAVFVTIH